MWEMNVAAGAGGPIFSVSDHAGVTRETACSPHKSAHRTHVLYSILITAPVLGSTAIMDLLPH